MARLALGCAIPGDSAGRAEAAVVVDAHEQLENGRNSGHLRAMIEYMTWRHRHINADM